MPSTTLGSRGAVAYDMLGEMVIDGAEVPDDGNDVDHVGDLIALVAAGDRVAFARLYEMMAARMFGLVRRVVVDPAQSEEVLQEVFLEIWQSASHFAPNKGQGRSWMLTIAHRRSVDRVRAARARAERDVRIGLRDQPVSFDSVAEEVELQIAGTAVRAAISELPDAQREAIVLAYFGGYSQSEIAALTNTALGTIKTRMRDGLTRLRREMGVSGGTV